MFDGRNLGHGFRGFQFFESCSCSCLWVSGFQFLCRIWIARSASARTRRYPVLFHLLCSALFCFLCFFSFYSELKFDLFWSLLLEESVFFCWVTGKTYKETTPDSLLLCFRVFCSVLTANGNFPTCSVFRDSVWLPRNLPWKISRHKYLIKICFISILVLIKFCYFSLILLKNNSIC